MSDTPSADMLASLALALAGARGLTVRVNVDTTRDQSDVADVAQEWSRARGRIIARTELRNRTARIDAEATARAGFPVCHIDGLFVDFYFLAGCDLDLVAEFARIVGPFATDDRPLLLIDPKGAEA